MNSQYINSLYSLKLFYKIYFYLKIFSSGMGFLNFMHMILKKN